MASKNKAERMTQKTYWEFQLDQRLSSLRERGVDAETMAKDATVRKIRGEIRKAGRRLKAIVATETKKEELLRAKAEKMAAPKKEDGKKKKEEIKEEPESSKRQQKKKKKLAEKAES